MIDWADGKSLGLAGMGECGCTDEEGMGFLKNLIKKAGNVIGKVVGVAAPVVGGIIGGPIGAAAGQVVGSVGSALLNSDGTPKAVTGPEPAVATAQPATAPAPTQQVYYVEQSDELKWVPYALAGVAIVGLVARK